MKILFITPRFPYPPLRGDQVIPYYRLRTLGQKHEITILSFYEKPNELVGIKQIEPYCDAIYTVRLPKWQSLSNMAGGVFLSDLPLQVLYYRSSAFQTQLKIILEQNHFDLVHAFMLRIAPYVSTISAPKVIELIDSMQLNLERRLSMEPVTRRWLFQEELRRIISYEQKIGDFFDRMIVVAEKDRALIKSDRVQVIPNGVDTNLFKPELKAQPNPVIIFSGNMGYAPNINAVNWFVELCLPRIQQVIPSASLIIAGANPNREMRGLERRGQITVTGFVDSMAETLNQASVAIAPMQSGSGIQNKILEAMACELPVVTTTLGLGSIKAQPGQEILVADSPESFADTLITLLQNPQLTKEIGQRARTFVIQNHSWEYGATQIEEVYNQILDRRSLD
jgi:sugar transferase (PEP-CTERM/EpsH1 system associated)